MLIVAILLSLNTTANSQVIRKVEAVAGEIAINPRPNEFTLTYTHRDLGRDTDCRGVLTAEVIVGRKARIVQDIAFSFSDVAPTETYTMRFGGELLESIRAAHPDIDPTFIKFDKNSDYLDIKTAHCFFGPPIDTKIILGKPQHLLRVYVHPSSVHALFTNEDSPPFYHYRCTVGIAATVLKSKNPDKPQVFTITTGQVSANGASHAFGGVRPIQERRAAEGKMDLEYDPTPGKTRIANRYCWQGGAAQFATNHRSGFAILPGGEEVLRYSPAKSNGVIATITTEKDGPSLDSSLRAPWQAVTLAADGTQFAVSSKSQIALFDLASFKEQRVFNRGAAPGDFRLHAKAQRLVTFRAIVDTATGKTVHRFGKPLSSHDISADGQHLIASVNTGQKSVIRLIKLSDGAVQKEWGNYAKPPQVAVVGDMFLAAEGTKVHSHDLTTGAVRRSWDIPTAVRGISVTTSAFAVLGQKEITVWQLSTGQRLALIPYTGSGMAVRLAKTNVGYVVGIKRRLVRKNLLDFWPIKL